MRKSLWACLLALPILALSGRAHADYKVDCGCSPHFNVSNNGGQWGTGGSGGGLFQAGPWYSYWPYKAHFAQPAPLCFPFWPGPAAGPQFLPPPPPAPAAPGAVVPGRPNGFQPVGYDYSGYQAEGAYYYYYYGQAPSYWYGR
jgi:hypothetical protein